MSDDQLFVLLGLRDEEERAKKSAQVDESNNATETSGHAVIEDIEGAANPVDDAITGELVILYDKNNPCMDKGTKYPSMKEFGLAVRQFAINKEFELHIEKSDPERKRKPRKNNTKYPPEPSTPIMTTNRDTLMQESPGMVTRRCLAMLLGDKPGTTGEAGSIWEQALLEEHVQSTMIAKKKD
ncbi:hypothetical protein E2562_001976 [Oryza meyeriana var. granulata]|uniref:Uncharacterized protein n=1 Tax=Oryza meyeriana var. granulata TaxID=110450 RepID=A0A6G1C544_9ORYZ|nr:hypothetical protein E2562_001976 [Oryza meyeriana var. granulata]